MVQDVGGGGSQLSVVHLPYGLGKIGQEEPPEEEEEGRRGGGGEREEEKREGGGRRIGRKGLQR